MNRLHVGPAVLAWIRDTARETLPADAVAAAFYGLPVILEPGWHAGRWETRRDGRTVDSGQIGDPTKDVLYIPGRGFYEIAQVEIPAPQLPLNIPLVPPQALRPRCPALLDLPGQPGPLIRITGV